MTTRDKAMPKWAKQVLADVQKNDRIYFEKNPEATSYTRPYVRGEFRPLANPEGNVVLVEQIMPDVRSRTIAGKNMQSYPGSEQSMTEMLDQMAVMSPSQLDEAVNALRAQSKEDQTD